MLWAVVVRHWMYSVMHPKRLRLLAPLPLIEAIPVDQGEVEAVLQEIIAVEHEVEEESTKPYLQGMTKKQLEEYGRTLGIELDRRHTKKKLIATLEALDK